MPSPSLVVATSLSRPWQLLLAVVIGPGLSSGVPTAAAVIAPPSASHNNNVGHATAQNTVKILVCGDSITQGADGDFTWRYRLWEWFQANAQRPQSTSLPLSSSLSSPYTSTTTIVTGHLGSAAAQTFLTPTLQFVGPYNGTLPASVGDDIDLSDPQTWGRYHATVDAAFWPGGGSQHFAVYGRPAWMDIDLIAAHVAQQQPDVVVLHLGFNDVGWWSQTAPELVATMHRLVQNARRGRPDVAILVADVSHRLLVAGREDIPPTTDQYNALLAQNALVWSTEESPVWVVKVSEDYDCHTTSCPAGKDGLHPNALGDFQIARAYTKTLHDKFHYGAQPLVVPNIESIPGLTIAPIAPTTTASNKNVLMDPPPMGIFILVSLSCLLAVFWFRPRWTKALRGIFVGGGGGDGRSGNNGEGKYQLLPTTAAAAAR